ncbi:hypothetical protein, conserved [Trypanosoma cruzi]|uniref:C3H1-type domain-containing protein n=1 Tax=Trypanosoma cruzi (strain CL Brener) TaxID=353153 RepID=Q4DJJ6_TRYCC|nr:hypothetical protein, conserved [Trypanosoma cruzi]EAN92692.1 hypothetical protein, conserved [Trypanosoma cruzi]|eukprot:XP_814543.1 hypothetical protein [Trypanosoma cruzi strain CL Brener]
MFYVDACSQNYRMPNSAPVFSQGFPQPNRAPSLVSPNDVQNCTNDGLVNPHQAPLFTVSQQGSVVAASVLPRTVLWTANGMYGVTQMREGPEEGATRFVPSKSPDGTPVSAMQSMFLPPMQQQQQQQQQASNCPLLYILTTVAVPQTYPQTSLQEQKSQHVTPVTHQIISMKGPSVAPSQSIGINTLNPSCITNNSDAMQTCGSGSKVNVNVVCRHFIKSCCNRRKCRFLHTLNEAPLANI